MRRAFLPYVFILIALGCDTPGSLEPDEKDYFLKFYGIEGNQTGVDFVVNPDGTYVLVGSSRIALDSSQQIYVVKADPKGKVIWQKTFGDKTLDEEAKDIELLSDGNLIVAGNTERIKNGDRDVYLILLTQDGSVIKETRQGLKIGANDADEDVASVTEISAGITNPAGFIVAGSTTGSKSTTVGTDTRDAMHMRFTTQLARVTGAWSDIPTFGGFGFEGEDAVIKVIQYGPNDYFMFGYSNVRSGGTTTVVDFDFWVYGRTDDGGSFGTSKFIGEIGINEKLTSVSISPIVSGAGAGYVLSGSSSAQNSPTSSPDVYLARLSRPDAAGIIPGLESPAKQLNLDLGIPSQLKAYSFVTNFGYLLTTNISGGTTSGISLWKLNSLFKVLNPNKIEFSGAGNDFAGPVFQQADGKIVTIGTMTLGGVDGQKKMVFMKLNSEGRLAP